MIVTLEIITIRLKKEFVLEYVSANPTGLMHIGHARGAVLGDTIASILEEVGHDVCREYYINDAGEQIKKTVTDCDISYQKQNQIKQFQSVRIISWRLS